ncbi:unnamed protein product [Phaeothamnion confervicola]
MADADEGLQRNDNVIIDVEAGDPPQEPLPPPLLAFLTSTQRIQQWKRTRHTSTSLWWMLGRGWSKYRNGKLKGTIICENCVADGMLDKAEVNYGSSKSTGKVKQHYKTHHSDIYEEGQKLVLRGAAEDDKGQDGEQQATLKRQKTEHADIRASFEVTAPPWIEELCRFVVMQYQPLSIVSSPEFKTMVSVLEKRAAMPSSKMLFDYLVRYKLSLHGDIAAMTKGQKEAVTVDGWTSRAGDQYFSLTRHFINEQWELTSLALDCVKHVGSTCASDLVRIVEDLVERANVTAINLTTDCEPSMVAAGRETKFQHSGCLAHRLESVTGIFFDGPGEAGGVSVVKLLSIFRNPFSNFLLPECTHNFSAFYQICCLTCSCLDAGWLPGEGCTSITAMFFKNARFSSLIFLSSAVQVWQAS